MSRTIAITGATGFIGAWLAKRLTSTGWHIRALVRAGSLDRRPKEIEPEWITGDLDDQESLERLVRGVDAVVHCAGVVRGASQNDFDRINIEGVTRLVKVAAKQHPVPRFLLLSSLAAREPQLSFYAASKRNGERELAANAGKMFWGILRPPAVYGPGDREMLPIFQWMLRGFVPLIGSERNRVSLLYVGDLADAIISWLQHAHRSEQCYDLHDGHQNGYSWQEIIDVVEHLNGKSILRINIPVFLVKLIASVNLLRTNVFGGSPMLTPGKVRELVYPNWVADNDQLSIETGWVPRVLLEEGLKLTLGR
jgi:nucleoside-diphosphate-sugar epimerase